MRSFYLFYPYKEIMQLTITQIDTACMLIDINGFRILTDPAFDEAGSEYLSPATGRILKKLKGPALQPADIGVADLVLLSHDQHKDNLDNAGREYIKTVPSVISTREAQERLGLDTVTGIDEWQTVQVKTDKVPGLRITGTPCQHAPDKEGTKISGHVLGFILEWDEQKNGAFYISGDTVYFDGIEEIATRYTVDTAILHIGKAGFPKEMGHDKYLTFTAAEAIRVAKLFKLRRLIPTHLEGWEHFTEKPAEAHARMLEAGLESQLLWLVPGKPVQIGI
jgi:L-ascorbate metabolism protein UlaG (beta-lactamase superfamily)